MDVLTYGSFTLCGWSVFYAVHRDRRMGHKMIVETTPIHEGWELVISGRLHIVVDRDRVQRPAQPAGDGFEAFDGIPDGCLAGCGK